MKNLKLKEQERVVDELRQYGLTLLWSYMIGFILLFIAALFMSYLFRQDWWGLVLFAVICIVALYIIGRTYFLWRYNVMYITTHRIVDIEQQGFFSRHVSDISYDKIEDVSAHMRGIMHTIFRYGSVTIHTSQKNIKIIAPKIKRPLHVQQYINEMRDRYIQKYAHDFSTDVASTMIDKLYELELPDLRRVQKVLDNRIQKLSKHI